MKVAFVNYYYDKDIPIDNYFDEYPTIHGWSKELSELGLKVSVYHRFNQNSSFIKDGVNYFLIKDDKSSYLKWYQNPTFFQNKISEENQDIIHINSFIYSYQACLLRKKNPSAKIVIQHHAERPRYRVKRFLLRNFSSSVDGFIFSSIEIYNDWLKVKSIVSDKKFSEIMEGSSHFTSRNRDEMRIKTGLGGNPVLLWVGRLDENKDPLTVLSGFSKLLRDFPDASLYMIYSEEKLKQQVLSYINQNEFLKNSVRLLGFINYKDICDYYNSADYFVLGSHYEGSGYSLVEAMSCGIIPIVTNIPSFRMITNKGQIGALWNCGDAESFYNKAKEIIQKPLEVESKKALDYFSNNLSYPAIGKKAKNFYESLIGN
ncbi:MAG: glycosyltransferase family 4 protein [Ignavibacteria bacterium]|nr:glycosyltransferase family 4 protein [Ignavibacteria bacterium]MBT8381682.1 glycosyltransferase family 4 protein [Ignavibacteria bacterium]MBT8392970.1 glycosyltransferase family 4 protein [Ignavibacteria bacterium]NNJ52718.1 glycosyltransferase family 4 protein [Ignavibacteriaceae bacterium]NNL20439.1 glycosyltransferase family 4 protein [Ignavibacteriaceae bacterium]